MGTNECGCGISASTVKRSAWKDGCTERINRLRDAYWKYLRKWMQKERYPIPDLTKEQKVKR